MIEKGPDHQVDRHGQQQPGQPEDLPPQDDREQRHHRKGARGIDLGDRWNPIADQWAPLANAGNYAFNDAHAMMAFVGSGRTDAQQAVIDALRGADGSRPSVDTAHPDLRAIVAHATERYGLSPEDFASLTWLVTPDSKRAN